MPEPLLPVAIAAKSKADEDKLSPGAEPAGGRGPDAAAGEQRRDPPARAVVHGRGARRRAARPAEQRGTASRWRRSTCGCRCGRRSAARRQGLGRNVKQTGGHGQYAICHIEVEPLPSGGGLRVRRQDRRRRGAAAVHPVGGEGRPGADGARASLAGYPMVDVRVTLYDGKAHSVDSSDMAFQIAGRARAQGGGGQGADAAAGAGGRGVGAGRRRLRRRGDVRPVRRAAAGCSAPSRSAPGAPWSRPRCPELEITRYAIDLRSMSHGTGHVPPRASCATSRCRPRTIVAGEGRRRRTRSLRAGRPRPGGCAVALRRPHAGTRLPKLSHGASQIDFVFPAKACRT